MLVRSTSRPEATVHTGVQGEDDDHRPTKYEVEFISLALIDQLYRNHKCYRHKKLYRGAEFNFWFNLLYTVSH